MGESGGAQRRGAPGAATSKKTPEMRPNVSRSHSAAGNGPITWDVIEEAHFAKGTRPLRWPPWLDRGHDGC